MTAADVTSKRVEVTTSLGAKELLLVAQGTFTGGTDYVTFKLADYGISNVLSVEGNRHTTDYEVMVPETPDSTELSDGVFKIVTSTGNNNGTRVYLVKGI